MLWRRWLSDHHRQPRHVEAEAGIEFVGQRRQPLGKQRTDLRRIAQRVRTAGGDAAHRAVGAEQCEFDTPRAVAAPLQRDLQAARQPLRSAEDVFLARNRLGKALFGDIRRNRQPRIERLVLQAQRAVELAQQVRAEAGGQRAARQVHNIADTFQADARQPRHRSRRQPQRGKRQRRENAALLAANIAFRLAVMRGGVSRADGAGNGERKSKAGAIESLGEIGDERALAAVKMRAAADVEQQTVGRITRHQRRIAQTPVGNVFEQLAVCLGVFLGCFDRRVHGARLRQRQAGREPELLRCLVDGDEQLGIAALAVDDERRCFADDVSRAQRSTSW